MIRRLTALLATCAALAGLAAASGPAFAGTYDVSACSPFSTTGPWTEVNTAPAGLTAGQLCGGPAIGPLAGGDQGAMYGEDILNSPAAIANGAEAGWMFTAPPQTAIVAISYYRALSSYKESDLVAGLFQANGAPLEQCMIGLEFGSSIVCSMPNSQAPVTFAGLNTGSLFFGVACHVVTVPGASCIDGATIHAAQADLYSAKVTLLETALPTLGQPSGALWAGGVVSGVVPVGFSASDPSGIAQDLVRTETGQNVIFAGQSCDFTTTTPCPQLPAGSLSVDTTRVPDGPHTFSLLATDAAGNTQTATSPSVVVDNNGPPAPTGLTATPASSSTNAINLSWTNPAGPPQPVTGAMVQLCQATCPAAVPVSSSGTAQITAPAPGTYSVRLWLTDTQGRGSASNAALATVTVPASGSGTKPGAGPGTTPPGTTPPATTTRIHTKLAAAIHGRELHITGTLAAVNNGAVKVSWRSRSFGITLGSGSRTVQVHSHRLVSAFTLSHRARTGNVHVAVRTGAHLRASALARPS